jgi:hypothetical protein
MNRFAVKWLLIFSFVSCSESLKESSKPPAVCAPFCDDGVWIAEDYVITRFFCGVPRDDNQFDRLLINGLRTWAVRGDTLMLTTEDARQSVNYGYRQDHDTLLLASRIDSAQFVIKHVSADKIQLELWGLLYADISLARQK